MNFVTLVTYGDSHERAFEALCNQLFERWLKRKFDSSIVDFNVVNGEGGDGGVEAYCTLNNGNIIGVQAKWYRDSLKSNQIGAIKKSILTAKQVRPSLKRYIICIPRNFSNKKMVKGKKIAEKTEYDKIKDLKAEINKNFSDLKLEFWGEHKLREEIQESGNEGINRFWFEKELISFEHLQNRFQVAKAGWLSPRYIPDLHAIGFIQEAIDRHLYEPKYRNELVNYLKTLNSRFYETIDLTNAINKHRQDKKLSELASTYKRLAVEIENLILNIDCGISKLKFEFTYDENSIDFLEYVDTLPTTSDLLIIKQKLIGLLSISDISHLQSQLSDLINFVKPQAIIFSGKPGSGKTHAVANAVEGKLRQGIPALIIEAQNSPVVNWGTILKFGIAAFQTWDENEILTALEALVHISEIKRAINGDNKSREALKFLLVVDGVEEATNNWNAWGARINELRAYVDRYPRLQFVFTCRNYYLQGVEIKDEYPIKIYHLPWYGDISIIDLFPAYSKHFNTPNAPWIAKALNDLLSLRLFCELYQNQENVELDSMKVTLIALLKEKIKRLENELNRDFSTKWQPQDQVVRKILNAISEELINKEIVERGELISLMTKSASGFIDEIIASRIINSFKNHGILIETQIINAESFRTDSFSYSFTYNSILEYMIATSFAEQINNGISPKSEILLHRRNILQIISNILISDYDKKIEEEKIWQEIDDATRIEIKCQSLLIVKPDISTKYMDWVKREFVKSYKNRSLILVNLIIPASKINGHPLGAILIHEILSNYKKTYQRDIVWSGPDFSEGNEDLRIAWHFNNLFLTAEDKLDGLPLLMIWCLTNADNIFRSIIKRELTYWGLHNQKNILELLKMFFRKYDPQIDEDLSIVMLGITSLIKKPTNEFKQIALWVLRNIFSDIGINQINNVVILSSFRGVIERAYFFKLIRERDLISARPPYNLKIPMLNLDIEKNKKAKLDGASLREGRFPIVHDLDWYVIDKSYRGFLDYGTNKSIENFFKPYSKKYKKKISPKEFSVSAAIYFIKKLGWNRYNGPGYTEATHGSLSSTSTFEEKYTWLAVHEIKGYLAKYLPYKSSFNDTNVRLLDNYNKIISIHNPANDFETNFFPFMQSNWIVPSNIAPTLKFEDKTLAKDIKKWVNTDHKLDFKKWVDINTYYTQNIIQAKFENWLTLSNYTCFSEPNNIGRVSVHLDSFIIKKKMFGHFFSNFKKNKSWQKHELNPEYLHSSPETATYLSPIDVVCMNWLTEQNEEITLSNDIIIRNTTLETHDLREGKEIYYKMPARHIRKWLGITTGNGKVFLNDKGDVAAIQNELGQQFYDYQRILLVDQELFYKKAEKEDSMIVWIAFVFQDTTMRIKEISNGGKNLHSQNARLWLVWEENGKIKRYKFHQGYFR